MKKIGILILAFCLTAGVAAAADDASWLKIGGDYRFRYDYLKGTVPDFLSSAEFSSQGTSQANIPVAGHSLENDSLMLNRFGLNLQADAVEDVVVKARLIMYKVWGHETEAPVQGTSPETAFGPTDATVGHWPSDNTLRVDSAYATVSNVFGGPVWFTVGRRPTTGGIPTNLRQNLEKPGTASEPGLMVNYAFDGLTLGYAPDIDALPGFYVKASYGKGFDSGSQGATGASLEDSDFAGFDLALVDTDAFHFELEYLKGWHIGDMPSDGSATFKTTGPTENLGSIQWAGGVITGKLAGLNLFVSAVQSKTDPNWNTFNNNSTPWGLLWTGTPEKETGYSVYAGARYDFSTKTKLGAEYNHGSRYWIGLVPDDDDIWTSKLGTRGTVYEVYLIQELDRKPISRKGKAFFRLGYQYYKFDYTGSNFWIGAPTSMSDVASVPQILVPVKDAKDIYLTFDVQF